MSETKVISSYKEIVNYFMNQGCSIEESINLTKICPELFSLSINELDKKVHLMYNSDVLYGIIICNQNNLKEYLYLQTNKQMPTNDYSYITQNFLDTINKQEYIQTILGIQPTDTLEDKLYKMKKASFNSSGYKIK